MENGHNPNNQGIGDGDRILKPSLGEVKNYTYLLSENLDEERMSKYLQEIYEKLKDYDESGRKKEMVFVFKAIFFSPGNYEIFVKTLLGNMTEWSLMFLRDIRDLIITDEAEHKEFLENIFGGEKNKKEGYFVLNLKSRIEELRSIPAEERGELYDEFLKTLDDISGAVFFKKRNLAKNDLEECYIGFMSAKLERMEKNLVEKLGGSFVSSEGEAVIDAEAVSRAVKEAMSGFRDEIVGAIADASAPQRTAPDAAAPEIRELAHKIDTLMEAVSSLSASGAPENASGQSAAIDEVRKLVAETALAVAEIKNSVNSLMQTPPSLPPLADLAPLANMEKKMDNMYNALSELVSAKREIEELRGIVERYIEDEREFIQRQEGMR